MWCQRERQYWERQIFLQHLLVFGRGGKLVLPPLVKVNSRIGTTWIWKANSLHHEQIIARCKIVEFKTYLHYSNKCKPDLLYNYLVTEPEGLASLTRSPVHRICSEPVQSSSQYHNLFIGHSFYSNLTLHCRSSKYKHLVICFSDSG
jgi:hypothetical protein